MFACWPLCFRRRARRSSEFPSRGMLHVLYSSVRLRETDSNRHTLFFSRCPSCSAIPLPSRRAWSESPARTTWDPTAVGTRLSCQSISLAWVNELLAVTSNPGALSADRLASWHPEPPSAPSLRNQYMHAVAPPVSVRVNALCGAVRMASVWRSPHRRCGPPRLTARREPVSSSRRWRPHCGAPRLPATTRSPPPASNFTASFSHSLSIPTQGTRRLRILRILQGERAR